MTDRRQCAWCERIPGCRADCLQSLACAARASATRSTLLPGASISPVSQVRPECGRNAAGTWAAGVPEGCAEAQSRPTSCEQRREKAGPGFIQGLVLWTGRGGGRSPRASRAWLRQPRSARAAQRLPAPPGQRPPRQVTRICR